MPDEAAHFPPQIMARRSQKDVDAILKDLKRKALAMQRDKRYHYSKLMETALAYMLNGWDDLLKYRHRGDYTIDNMVAYPNFFIIQTYCVKRYKLTN